MLMSKKTRVLAQSFVLLTNETHRKSMFGICLTVFVTHNSYLERSIAGNCMFHLSTRSRCGVVDKPFALLTRVPRLFPDFTSQSNETLSRGLVSI